MLIKFCISFAVFLGIDLLWLGIIARPIYVHYLGDFLREKPHWPMAFLFYALFVWGLLMFVIEPAIEAKDIKQAFVKGAFFGFFTYMTYELTNFSVLKNWPIGIVPIDIAWGICLSSLVCGLSTLIYLKYVA